jgi:histone-lysine N-methyltransferase SETD2/UMP-CMP kinase
MGAKGYGLISGEKIKKGQFVIQYIGEVLSLSSEEGVKRLNDYSKSTCTYMMKLGGNEVIDPSYKGNMARFINHSCDPNCETQKWNVLGEICVGIFATKDILPGQELSFNYQFDVYQTPFTRCLCGTANCKKYLGLVPPEYTPEEWFEKVENMPCELCGSNDAVYDDQFLLCDNCNRGYHTFCLIPKLEKIPEGAWFCPRCVKEKEQPSKEAEEAKDDMKEKKSSVENISLTKVLKRDKERKKLKLLKSRSKKRPGRPRKNVMDEEELDDLSDYNEFYNLQKSLQRELIEMIGKEALVDYEEAQNEDDDEEGVEEEHVATSKNITSAPKKIEKKSKLDEIKEQVMSSLKKLLEEHQLLKKLDDSEFIKKLNKDQNIKRRAMSISTIELSIFKSYIFRKTNKMAIRLSLDTNPYKRDIFAKKNEFRIQCNDSQYDWFRDLFILMDQATSQYKVIKGFTTAYVSVPAIFIKRIVGEYQKTVHHLQAEYNETMQYDKSFITDECYPLSETCKLSLKGIKENIMQGVEYIQSILDTLEVRRIFMSSSDIKIIISNLMPIKQQIHPSEIRCCRDNALRDINHPFYTIYYKDKEVAFVGTKEELDKSVALVESEIAREKKVKKNIFSLNYLIPVCDKYHLIKIKERLEKVYANTKLIIYDPLLPRKNVSLTLVSNYINFKEAYEDLRDSIDDQNLFKENFENYQKQTVYQMAKYFFKYLQNYFQTESTIFMKAWDTMTLDFLGNCNGYESIFKEIKSLYIRDHELKFYILSVTKMSLQGGYKNIGLTKGDIITICKSILNRVILYDDSLYSKNYQSIFPFDSDLPNFLQHFQFREEPAEQADDRGRDEAGEASQFPEKEPEEVLWRSRELAQE